MPKDTSIASEIEVALLCEALHTLPNAGGLLDQDPDWVFKMRVILHERAEAAKKHAKSS